MKYKIGDKVRIRKDLMVGLQYGEITFQPHMKPFKEKVGTITIKIGCKYKIDLDNNLFWYSQEMLEPVQIIDFTKSDIESGMIIEVDYDGDKSLGLVVKCDYKYNGKEDFVVLYEPKDGGFDTSSSFKENLTTNSGAIVTKIFAPKDASNFKGLFERKDNLELIWDRYAKSKVTELTLQQIADKYGIPVKQLRIKDNE